MRKKYLIVNIVMVSLCLALLSIVIFRQSTVQSGEPGVSGEDLPEHPLEITNLDVGKADAAVIRFQPLENRFVKCPIASVFCSMARYPKYLDKFAAMVAVLSLE